MTNEDDTAGRRNSCFYDANNVGNRQASEDRPHVKVLKAGRRGWKLVAERVVLHIDAYQVVQSRSREAQDPGNLFSMEQVRSLVPVNPHSAQVVAQKIVERIPGKEGQAVRDPVCFIGHFVEIGFGPLAQVPYRLSPFFISTRPYPQANTVQGVR